jgi:hypothetical protein
MAVVLVSMLFFATWLAGLLLGMLRRRPVRL